MDAIAEATVSIQPHNGDTEYGINLQTNQPFVRTFSGHGASTDIVVASARAYLSALNKLLAAREEQASVSAREATHIETSGAVQAVV
jgi:2-isopropylmalate synthase